MCETPWGRLMGVCVHEITNGRLLRTRFGRYLTVVKQSTKIWPPGSAATGQVINKVQMKRKNDRIWIKNYMDVFHTNLLMKDGTVYMLLEKYNRFKGQVEPYLSLKMLG